MKANYKIEAGDVRVIRPLCYAREALTKDFARTNRLPLVNENCPACFEEPKERHRVKKVGVNFLRGPRRLGNDTLLCLCSYSSLRSADVPKMYAHTATCYFCAEVVVFSLCLEFFCAAKRASGR